MPIEEHKNLGLENLGGRGVGAAAVGSSNSNSHNAGGSELNRQELEQVMSQLSELLPRLQAAAERRQEGNP
jgi:hypothetical protein